MHLHCKGFDHRVQCRVCRLRTSRNLWNITERQETVTEDCYSYTVGADVLVVLTNRGSNLGNATKTCSVQLPASSQLMRKGLASLQDVLDFNQVRPQADLTLSIAQLQLAGSAKTASSRCFAPATHAARPPLPHQFVCIQLKCGHPIVASCRAGSPPTCRGFGSFGLLDMLCPLPSALLSMLPPAACRELESPRGM